MRSRILLPLAAAALAAFIAPSARVRYRNRGFETVKKIVTLR